MIVTARTFNPRGKTSPAKSSDVAIMGEVSSLEKRRSLQAPRVERFHTTVTERGGFRTCRRRWRLDTVERLQHKDRVPWNLIFGECIHSALQRYYTNNTRKLQTALRAFRKAWKEEDDRLEAIYGSLYSMGIQGEWYAYKEKGETMLTYYDIYDSQSAFQWKEVIAVNVEERAYVDILNLDREHMPSLPLLSGRIDLVVRRKNGIWIIDHKTAASAYDARAIDVDDQLTGYCYIWWRLTGEVPRGAIYNALIKEPPRPPKVLVDGVSLSKAKDQRTTYDLYVAAMAHLGIPLDHPDYQDILTFLEKKGWNSFFVRDGIEKNLEELESFEKRLYYEYLDMEQAEADENWAYPNPSQFNCAGCGVLPICQTMEEQGDAQYLKDNMYEAQEPRYKIPAKVLSKNWKGV